MIRLVRNSLALLAVLGGIGLCGAPAARADLLPISYTQSAAVGGWQSTYQIALSASSEVLSGDYFTVYDFNGFVPGSALAPAGWTLSTQNVGITPPILNPVDNPSVTNLTWTYNGAPLISSSVGAGGIPTTGNVPNNIIGNFSAVSTLSGLTTAAFTSQNHIFEITAQFPNGTLVASSNATSTYVPAPGASPPPNSTPEPATLTMIGIGLPLLGAFRLIRRRRTEV